MKFTIYFLGFLLLQQLAAQDETQYSFKHYNTTEGLASTEVTAVTQDRKGYVWIGTNNGVQRFDGTRYKTFRSDKNDPSSIPNGYILQMLLDKNDDLWILTGDGKVGIFDTKQFKYREVKVILKNDALRRIERKLIHDEDGHLFLLYFDNEYVTWSEQKKEFSAAYNFIPVSPDWRIINITQQPGTKKYWLSTRKGTVIYNVATKRFSYTGHNDDREAFIDQLGDIFPGNMFFDKQGRIWFDAWVSEPRIFLFDLKKNETILSSHLLPLTGIYHETRGFLQQTDGTIWIKGLSVFAKYLEKEKKFQFISTVYQNERSINYDRVNDFFEDKEKNLWIATNNNGLYRFDPASQFFKNISHLSPLSGKIGKGSLLSFIETKKGELLTASWSDGLFMYDSNYSLIPLNITGLPEKHPNVWSMTYAPDSSILWLASQPGIYEVNMKTRTSVYHNAPAIKKHTIRQIAADRYGSLWLGMQDLGVFKWTAARGQKKWEDGLEKIEAIPSGNILKIMMDNRGSIWIGTSGNGAYAIDPATNKIIEHLGVKESPDKRLLWDEASSIVQYNDSLLAIVAQGVHLYNINRKTIVTSIKTPESISSNLTSVEKDNNGYLWVSSTNGLLRVNVDKGIFVHFDRADGITNDRFVNAASYVKKDGTLLFGADDEFVAFDPTRVQINEATPSVTITDFKVMNRSLLVDSLMAYHQIELSPDQNSITIEFSALHYEGAFQIKYKLNNLDKDWIVADANNQAVYSYLPPGKYTFYMRTEDAEGNIGITESKLVIRINPPFWQTWWFYCLLALLVAMLLYVIDRERMKRLRDLQRMRLQIAGNLHEKVNTTLNNINLLSEMAKIKADKDIDRAKEYIDQISSKSHNMIIAMDDILWSINPENDNMEKTLLRMMEFIDALKNRYGVNIEMALDKRVRSLNLDMKTRHEFFLIFKEALRMIIQYAGGKETLINIDLFQHRLSMKLQDDTANFDTNIIEIEKSIKEMNTRAALIPAELDIQYDRNGIAVVLLVPAK